MCATVQLFQEFFFCCNHFFFFQTFHNVFKGILPANNLPVISDDMKKLLGNKKDNSTFRSLKNVSNADKLSFIKNVFIPGKSFVFPEKS